MKPALIAVAISTTLLISCVEPEETNTNNSILPAAVLHIPFDQTISDISSNGFEITNTGVMPTADRNGKADGAGTFGYGTYLEIPYDSLLENSEAFTLAAWAKSTKETYQEGFILDMGVASDYHYCLSFHESWGANGGYNMSRVGTSNIDITQWHHYCLTYDGSTLSFYLNGELVESELNKAPGNITDYSLRIGEQSKRTGSRYWEGAIDDVRMYDVALTSVQIQELQ